VTIETFLIRIAKKTFVQPLSKMGYLISEEGGRENTILLESFKVSRSVKIKAVRTSFFMGPEEFGFIINLWYNT